MKLNDGEITFELSMDSLAYLMVNHSSREDFLKFLERMADIGAGSNFEWEVIECLFGRLVELDATTARDLIEYLVTEGEDLV